MKEGKIMVRVYPVYKRADKREFEVTYNSTLEDLDKLIRLKFDGPSYSGKFVVGQHNYCSWKDLYNDYGFRKIKGLQQLENQRISNNPFQILPHAHNTVGTFDKTIFQLFVKDGIWKFKYYCRIGDTDHFSIELREVQ